MSKKKKSILLPSLQSHLLAKPVIIPFIIHLVQLVVYKNDNGKLTGVQEVEYLQLQTQQTANGGVAAPLEVVHCIIPIQTNGPLMIRLCWLCGGSVLFEH